MPLRAAIAHPLSFVPKPTVAICKKEIEYTLLTAFTGFYAGRVESSYSS
jgi:hypothetical protein